jgi:flavin reductase (DIM6/NTAB) family NADH-FMN oxidoreductase RutF
MFIDPDITMRPDPLSHNPMNSLVAPRPIGWISTINSSGQVNLAPFSYFNAVSAEPPFVMFAPTAKPDGSMKDTFRNVSEVPEFVANLATWELREQMNQSSKSLDYGIDEMQAAGLHATPSVKVKPPRIAEAKASLECEVFEIIALPEDKEGRQNHVVIARVVGIQIDDELIVDGVVDSSSIRYMSRLGRHDYAVIDELYEMQRP